MYAIRSYYERALRGELLAVARVEPRECVVAALGEHRGLRAVRAVGLVADVDVAGEEAAEAHARRAQAVVDIHAVVSYNFV